MQVLAEITDYVGLCAALRARADELKLSGEALDELSGLAKGYAQKLIGPIPQRTLGPGMLDTMLSTLCVKLAVIHDQEALDKLSHRFTERDEKKVRKPPSVRTFTSRTYRSMGLKAAANMTAEQRRMRARRAALAKAEKRRANALAEETGT